MTHKEIIDKIDIVIQKYQNFCENLHHIPDYSTDSNNARRLQLCLEIYPLICETIERFIPSKNNFFSRSAAKIIQKCDESNCYSLMTNMPLLISILKSLKTAYNDNLLIELDSIFHADIFNDFLEMSEYLLSEGYKDAAAVMIGGVLEDNLRKLCLKNSISIVKPDS